MAVAMLGNANATDAYGVSGQWLFTDDGTVIQVEACREARDGLCAVIVKLPQTAASLPTEDKKKLCDAVLIGSLQPHQAAKGAPTRFDGWIVDPEELITAAQPEHHPVTFTLHSDSRARIEVRTMGIVVETYVLLRQFVSARKCG